MSLASLCFDMNFDMYFYHIGFYYILLFVSHPGVACGLQRRGIKSSRSINQ